MSKLMQRLPITISIAGIPHRAFVILVTPILLAITAVEAAWEAYILAEYSAYLTNFHKVFSGLNIGFLSLLTLLFTYTLIFGAILKRQKTIQLFAHIALLKGVLLFIIGLVHLISVFKDENNFKSECQSKQSMNFCNTLNTINIAFAVGLWLVQEIILLLIAIALNSYLSQNTDPKTLNKIEQGVDDGSMLERQHS